MTATDFWTSIRADAEKRRAERDRRLPVPCPCAKEEAR